MSWEGGLEYEMITRYCLCRMENLRWGGGKYVGGFIIERRLLQNVSKSCFIFGGKGGDFSSFCYFQPWEDTLELLYWLSRVLFKKLVSHTNKPSSNFPPTPNSLSHLTETPAYGHREERDPLRPFLLPKRSVPKS